MSSELIDIYWCGPLKPPQLLSFTLTVLSLNLDQVDLPHPDLLSNVLSLFLVPFGGGLALVVRCCLYLPPQQVLLLLLQVSIILLPDLLTFRPLLSPQSKLFTAVSD